MRIKFIFILWRVAIAQFARLTDEHWALHFAEESDPKEDPNPHQVPDPFWDKDLAS